MCEHLLAAGVPLSLLAKSHQCFLQAALLHWPQPFCYPKNVEGKAFWISVKEKKRRSKLQHCHLLVSIHLVTYLNIEKCTQETQHLSSLAHKHYTNYKCSVISNWTSFW